MEQREKENLMRSLAGTEQHRAITFDRKTVNVEKRTVDVAFSTEATVVERKFGGEQLSHDPQHVDMSRLSSGRAPLLLDHKRGKQIGVIENARIDADGVGRATVRFSKNKQGDDIFTDVQDGIRQNISTGYFITDVVSKQNREGKLPLVKVAWAPFEISFVSVDADTSTGVGRELPAGETVAPPTEPQTETPQVEAEVRSLTPTIKVKEVTTMIEKPETTAGTANTQTREETILAFARHFGDEGTEFAREFILSNDGDVNIFRKEFVTKRAKKQEATPQARPESELGLAARELKQYSVLRAVAAQLNGDWKNAGFERECNEEIVKRLGREPKRGNFFIPYDIQKRRIDVNREQVIAAARAYGMEVRDLSVNNNEKGGFLVADNFLAGSFIEMLRAQTAAIQLGARFLPGLVGDITIPRQNGAGTAYWVDEAETVTESEQVFGQLSMTPKTLGAVTEWTRKLALQSSPAIEQLVIEDLTAVMALRIDRTVVHGAGTKVEPQGIIGADGVQGITLGAAFAWADAVGAETALAEAEVRGGNRNWLMRPSHFGTLKTRLKVVGSTFPIYLVESDGRLNGYGIGQTTQVDAGNLLFGEFSNVVIGEWGTLEMLVNPFAKSRSGNVEVRLFQSIDIAIRYPQAFYHVANFS